jgi:uncharacterized protein
VEIIFSVLGITPSNRNIFIFTDGISFNYTTILNIIFLLISAVFIWLFLKTGGPMMFKMMKEPQKHEQGKRH